LADWRNQNNNKNKHSDTPIASIITISPSVLSSHCHLQVSLTSKEYLFSSLEDHSRHLCRVHCFFIQYVYSQHTHGLPTFAVLETYLPSNLSTYCLPSA
jgi:hypothetical protein